MDRGVVVCNALDMSNVVRDTWADNDRRKLEARKKPKFNPEFEVALSPFDGRCARHHVNNALSVVYTVQGIQETLCHSCARFGSSFDGPQR